MPEYFEMLFIWHGLKLLLIIRSPALVRSLGLHAARNAVLFELCSAQSPRGARAIANQITELNKIARARTTSVPDAEDSDENISAITPAPKRMASTPTMTQITPTVGIGALVWLLMIYVFNLPPGLHRSNKTEISHGRASWQIRWACLAMGPVGFIGWLDNQNVSHLSWWGQGAQTH
jgi:hypothetical protein